MAVRAISSAPLAGRCRAGPARGQARLRCRDRAERGSRRRKYAASGRWKKISQKIPALSPMAVIVGNLSQAAGQRSFQKALAENRVPTVHARSPGRRWHMAGLNVWPLRRTMWASVGCQGAGNERAPGSIPARLDRRRPAVRTPPPAPRGGGDVPWPAEIARRNQGIPRGHNGFAERPHRFVTISIWDHSPARATPWQWKARSAGPPGT